MHINDVFRVSEILNLVIGFYDVDLQAPVILTLWVQLYRDNEDLVLLLWRDIHSVQTWLDIQIDREIREIEDQDILRAIRRQDREERAIQGYLEDEWLHLSPRSDSSASWAQSW